MVSGCSSRVSGTSGILGQKGGLGENTAELQQEGENQREINSSQRRAVWGSGQKGRAL